MTTRRTWSLASLAAAAAAIAVGAGAAAAGCQFDPGGLGLHVDDTGGDTDAAVASIDAPGGVTIDASTPIDAPAPIDAATGQFCGPGGSCLPVVEECCTENGPPSCVPVGTCGQASCEAPSDCPGQVCCQWGGVVTACGTSCPGGEQVCEHNNDCPSNASHCCATQFGADVCRSSCF